MPITCCAGERLSSTFSPIAFCSTRPRNVLDHPEVDVALEQREAELLERRRKVLLRDPPLAFQAAEDFLELLLETFEHGVMGGADPGPARRGGGAYQVGWGADAAPRAGAGAGAPAVRSTALPRPPPERRRGDRNETPVRGADMIPNARRPLPGLALAALLALPAAARAQSNVLDLAIGDPARRDRTAPVVLDGVTDAATGEVVTPPELAARLDPVSLVFLGESHTDIEFHQVQLRVLEELRRRGRTVLIGLEMYPAGEQAVLDRWVAEAGLTEADFLKESRWYHNWGYHWEYYRAIFRFARESGARMFGLNVPRKVVQTARTQGLEALTPEQRALLPERIDTDSEEHRTLFKAFFSADDMHGQLPPEMFEGMFRAQCTWDGAMAHNAIRALRAARANAPSWSC